MITTVLYKSIHNECNGYYINEICKTILLFELRYIYDNIIESKVKRYLHLH